jgi:hypothetical protein
MGAIEEQARQNETAEMKPRMTRIFADTAG